MLAPNSVEMFPAETAQSMFDFRAEEVVGKIAPRPLLLDPRRQRFGDADRAVDRNVQARRPARRAASVQRARSLPVRGKFDAGVVAVAQLARPLFSGGEMSSGKIARRSRRARPLHPRRAHGQGRARRRRRRRRRRPGLGQSARRRRPRRVAAAALSETHRQRRDRHESRAAADAGPRRDLRARVRPRFRPGRGDAGRGARGRAGQAIRHLLRARFAKPRIPAPSAATRNGSPRAAAPPC